MTTPRWAPLFLTLAACPSPPASPAPSVAAPSLSNESSPPQPPPPDEAVTVATERTTASGLRFSVPAGWTSSISDRVVTLSDPTKQGTVHAFV